MRRAVLTLALATLFGGFLSAGTASACLCKKKVACAPAPVVYTTCAPAPAKCHSFKMPKIKMPKLGGCFHKKKVVCETCYAAPVTYATSQSVPSTQMLPVPQK